MKDLTPEQKIQFLEKELEKWRSMAMKLLREKYSSRSQKFTTRKYYNNPLSDDAGPSPYHHPDKPRWRWYK